MQQAGRREGHLRGELLDAARDLCGGRVKHAAAWIVLQRRKRPERVGNLLHTAPHAPPSEHDTFYHHQAHQKIDEFASLLYTLGERLVKLQQRQNNTMKSERRRTFLLQAFHFIKELGCSI